MAWLSACLPAHQALAGWNRLNALSRAAQGPTEPRTLTQLRTDKFAEAILTTDTHAKQWGAECVLEEGCVVRIGAAAKGSGMIHPQMATMLAFITTDAAVEPGALQALLREATERTRKDDSIRKYKHT